MARMFLAALGVNKSAQDIAINGFRVVIVFVVKIRRELLVLLAALVFTALTTTVISFSLGHSLRR